MFDPEKVSDIPSCILNEHNRTFRAVSRLEFDQLLEMYKDATHSLKWHNKADKETWKHRERLQNLLPAGYLGWHFAEASADYIERLHMERQENGKV